MTPQTLDGHIRATDTPSGMKDRIPPRKDTTVTVVIGPGVKQGQNLFLTITGGSATNGNADFHAQDNNYFGALRLSSGSGTYGPRLHGLEETAPPKAGGQLNTGNLYLRVSMDEDMNKDITLKKSEGFSVEAIAVAIKMPTATPRSGDLIQTPVGDRYFWGVDYSINVVSDSDQILDLNQVKISEIIVPQDSSGFLLSVGVLKGTFVGATQFNRIGVDHIGLANNQDTRAQALATMNQSIMNKGGPGFAIDDQYFAFTDKTMGIAENNAVNIPQSGFEIVQDLQQQANNYVLQVYRLLWESISIGVGYGQITDAAGVSYDVAIT